MQPFAITPSICYNTAAIPTKNDINDIVNILTTKTNFNYIHTLITTMIKNKGYSLLIILKEIILILIEKDNMINIIADLSDLENILTCSTFDDIYISAFISIFMKQ